MPQYLIVCVHRHVDFRLPEIDALLSLQGLEPSACYDRPTYYAATAKEPIQEVSPLIVLTLPTINHATFMSERGILVKGVYEILATGESYEKLLDYISNSSSLQTRYSTSTSWKLKVEAFGKSLSIAEQCEKRETVQHVFPGPVKMKDPEVTAMLLEEYTLFNDAQLKGIYLLQQLAGQYRNKGRGGARDLVEKLTLKKRKYLGPTSMDTELALVMANMGRVKTNDVVLDPFVGTGSILIPCAAFGAFCFGTDIDTRILSGKNKKNLFTNFAQYGFVRPEIIRADNSRFILNANEVFDAIVCDPPYGMRAGARKSGSSKSVVKPVEAQFFADHIPQTQIYEGPELMRDLVDLAARVLKRNGRLVYLLPGQLETFDPEQDIPTHPQMKVVAVSKQTLSKLVGRWLVTMEKL